MENKGPLKGLNGTKLILDDHGTNLNSFRISLESFRSFRGPLLLKPVTGQALFFAVCYSKPALVTILNGSYRQLVLFSVDNDSRNLLIHKNQDCGQNSWNNSHDSCPHRVSSKEGNSPATPFPSRGQSFGYYQFGRVNLKNEI